jgi:hypothetical protein
MEPLLSRERSDQIHFAEHLVFRGYTEDYKLIFVGKIAKSALYSSYSKSSFIKLISDAYFKMQIHLSSSSRFLILKPAQIYLACITVRYDQVYVEQLISAQESRALSAAFLQQISDSATGPELAEIKKDDLSDCSDF